MSGTRPSDNHPVTARIERVTWEAAETTLAVIRRTVFIEEQRVPEALEWDGLDATAIHVLAWADDQPVGCGRMLPDGHIGRMAVCNPYRGKGIGAQLLTALIDQATGRHTQVFLDAQVSAIGFYERFGFYAHGPVFMDAGIPHRHMTRTLPTPPDTERVEP